MKQIIQVFIGLLLVGGLLTGCTKNTIAIGDMSGDFTNLELTEEASGTVTTLDKTQSEEFYAEIKEMEFTKGKAAQEGTEGIYIVRFMKDTKELDQFIILDENTMIYQGSLYEAIADGFDMEYLMTMQLQVFQAEVISSDKGLLVAPEEGTDAYRSSDRISVGLNGTVVLNEEGSEIPSDELSAGDLVRIYYNGMILESYPAQITASKVEYVGRNLLLDGYLAVIDDIYQVDSALNADINVIAFDTTEWVGLTGINREIILTKVKEKYGIDTMEGTFEELAEQRLIDKDNLYFEKGILIELESVEYEEPDQVLRCSISKWRSGLGAIGADVKAEFDGEEWKLTKTNNWIS